jgi:hypothetical protein
MDAPGAVGGHTAIGRQIFPTGEGMCPGVDAPENSGHAPSAADRAPTGYDKLVVLARHFGHLTV